MWEVSDVVLRESTKDARQEVDDTITNMYQVLVKSGICLKPVNYLYEPSSGSA